jgi:hypothetical protein
MFTLLWKLFGGRGATAPPPPPQPHLPSDSLYDDLRHEAGQSRAGHPRIEDAPEPLSRALEQVISATKRQRARTARRGR